MNTYGSVWPRAVPSVGILLVASLMVGVPSMSQAQPVRDAQQRAFLEQVQVGGVLEKHAVGIFVLILTASNIGLCSDVKTHRVLWFGDA